MRYRVMIDGKQVLAPSRIGIVSNGVELGQDAVLGKPQLRRVNEKYKFFGAHAVAVNRAEEATVPGMSHGESYLVDVHVADDGVGVRLRLSAQPGRKVQADHLRGQSKATRSFGSLNLMPHTKASTRPLLCRSSEATRTVCLSLPVSEIFTSH